MAHKHDGKVFCIHCGQQMRDKVEAEDESTATRCAACGKVGEWTYETAYACPDCARKYPRSLLKAVSDPFDYALKLRTGEIIRFTQASISGDYATLYGDSLSYERPLDNEDNNLPYPFPRGLDVRVSDIVWCADAPAGS